MKMKNKNKMKKNHAARTAMARVRAWRMGLVAQFAMGEDFNNQTITNI